MEERLKTKTIEDVANALGISKTTVSRSISGKGRISEITRQKVLDYIAATDYRPNPNAKGLANARTYNLAWVIPGDSELASLSFFQSCLQGDAAAQQDHDVLIVTVSPGNISGLKRVVENRKADGVILGQSLDKDMAVDYMKSSGLPFVVVGSTYDPEVLQVDNDHISACSELSSILKMKKPRFVTLIGGDQEIIVNTTRRQGFEAGINPVRHSVYMNCVTVEEIERAVEGALSDGADCLVCADDRICYHALNRLKRDGVRIPEDMRVASFYNSRLTEDFEPSITSLHYDPAELGARACRLLIDRIEGREVPGRTLLGYEVLLKASTR